MRYAPIPSSLFADRRKQFASKMVPGSVAIFCSNDAMHRNGDQTFPFRQDSDLFALSGLDQPGTLLVLYPDARQEAWREMAFILPQDPQHAIWNGHRYSTREARQVSGIQSVYVTTRWDRIMQPIFKSVHTIYIHPHREDTRDQLLTTPNDRMAAQLRKEFPEHTFLHARSILNDRMMVKHPVELVLMQRAIEVSHQAFLRAAQTLQPGMKEFELEAEINYTLSKHGCLHAFEPIIASGASACTLHYVRNDRSIRKDELVLLDFGAEYAYMASDVTRILPASGHFTKRQREIYLAVLRVLDEVTLLMRPGITLPELNQEAGSLIDRELLRLKLITAHDLRRKDHAPPRRRDYFMHGVSHHLGYDVHDKYIRTAPLKSGMVLTCEPGLYIAEEGIGIRLENDILITRGKPRILTQRIPIHPDEIEDLMHSKK